MEIRLKDLLPDQAQAVLCVFMNMVADGQVVMMRASRDGDGVVFLSLKEYTEERTTAPEAE